VRVAVEENPCTHFFLEILGKHERQLCTHCFRNGSPQNSRVFHWTVNQKDCENQWRATATFSPMSDNISIGQIAAVLSVRLSGEYWWQKGH